jgi:hypothetical protein
MMQLYILEGHEPVPAADVIAWGEWFTTADREVAYTVVGDSKVSTVFMGLPTCMFETMVFGGLFDGNARRAGTWEHAEAVHAQMVEAVTAANKKD